MELVVVCCVSLLGSALTFFSGFGLGTVLLPAFALFLPVELAVAMTAVVHFLNNLFKLALVGKFADRAILVKFAPPALAGALVGAWLLARMGGLPTLAEFQLVDRAFRIEPVKLAIGILIAVFAIVELTPRIANFAVPDRFLPLGGLLSGFFGGLSGHQGALRSMFLIRAGLSKESFIATGVVIACVIDLGRLAVYGISLHDVVEPRNLAPLLVATFSAFVGAYVGNRHLKKVTLAALQKLVAVGLLLIATCMILGLI